MPSERKRLRRENGKIFELVTLGNRLVPYFEALAGEMAPIINNLTVDWFGVGLGERVYSRHQVFGQISEVFPTLRFNRAADDSSEFFTPDEPFKYRIIFRRIGEGLRFEAVERFLEDRFGRHWQGCDSDTSFVILTALGDLLPRLAQQGE